MKRIFFRGALTLSIVGLALALLNPAYVQYAYAQSTTWVKLTTAGGLSALNSIATNTANIINVETAVGEVRDRLQASPNFAAPATDTEINITFAAGGANQEVAPVRTDRYAAHIQWEGTDYVYCRESTSAATVAASGHTFRLGPGDYWESPLTLNGVNQEEINCIPSASAAGSLVGMELRQ